MVYWNQLDLPADISGLQINRNYIQGFKSYRTVNTLRICYKNESKLCKEIVAVCSENHTKHTNI